MKSSFMFVALFLAAALFAPTASAQQEQIMNKRELKALLASATTPEDHQKLAAYYTQEAKQLTAKATKHEEDAAARAKKLDYFAVKNPAVFGPQHCRDAAKRLHRDVAKAQILSQQHDEMARQATR